MTLQEVFMSIKDPRNLSGRRYSLHSILNLLTVGLMCGNNSLTRISKWFRTLPKKSAEALGFHKGRPSIATLSNILRVLPIEELEKALGCSAESDHLAVDGKSLRGTSQDTVKAVHILAAFIEDKLKVRGQVKLQEGENEITAAMRLIAEVVIEGDVITGDAIFAKKKFVKRL
jgi:hypothetical protein